MSKNEEEAYRIVLNDQNTNLFEKYCEDMYALTPNAKPLRYIKLYDDLQNLKNIIAKEHLEVFKHICEQHPNLKINFEFRIKSPASILEKSYAKTKEALENKSYNPEKPPTIYDGAAFRIVIDHVELDIAQSGVFFSEKTQEPFYAIRTSNNEILKLQPGDFVCIGKNQVVEITKDNLICNTDGSLSIRSENGDCFSLKNRIIQKRDKETLEKAVYDTTETLVNYLLKEGFICIPERKKDFVKNPKTVYKFKNAKQLIDGQYVAHSKRMQDKIRFLKENKDKINYQKGKRIVTASYKSLHYGAYDPKYHYYFEYQIRDFRMHEIAEKDTHIGHDTYKQLPIDATSKYRVPDSGAYMKFKENSETPYDYTFYDESYMYKKIFKKSKEEVLAEVAQLEAKNDPNIDDSEEPER